MCRRAMMWEYTRKMQTMYSMLKHKLIFFALWRCKMCPVHLVDAVLGYVGRADAETNGILHRPNTVVPYVTSAAVTRHVRVSSPTDDLQQHPNTIIDSMRCCPCVISLRCMPTSEARKHRNENIYDMMWTTTASDGNSYTESLRFFSF